MPNRILREGILTSRRVDRLSERAELFYRRLMSKLDDYGRCEADPELLRSACFPLRVNKVKPLHVRKWLQECREAGLLVIYEDETGKSILQYLDWKQQERSASKCAAPAKQLISDAKQMIALQNKEMSKNEQPCVADAKQMIANDINCSPSRIRIRSRSTYSKAYMSGDAPDVSPLSEQVNGDNLLATAKSILEFLNAKAGRRYQPVKANLDFIAARLRDGATETELRQVVAKKIREWKGNPKMAEYLRPATLFNREKFAQYQGELSNADGC